MRLLPCPTRRLCVARRHVEAIGKDGQPSVEHVKGADAQTEKLEVPLDGVEGQAGFAAARLGLAEDVVEDAADVVQRRVVPKNGNRGLRGR